MQLFDLQAALVKKRLIAEKEALQTYIDWLEEGDTIKEHSELLKSHIKLQALTKNINNMQIKKSSLFG